MRGLIKEEIKGVENTGDALGVSRTFRIGPSGRDPIIKSCTRFKGAPNDSYFCCLYCKPLPFLSLDDCSALGSHCLAQLLLLR